MFIFSEDSPAGKLQSGHMMMMMISKCKDRGPGHVSLFYVFIFLSYVRF